MTSTTCQICGASDFTKKSGYYICNNCDTQSQEVQVQDFEFIACNPVIDYEEREEEVLGNNEECDERKLTSWESYNLILKGLVEELIALGARSDLRSIAFQLWASYLKADGIAFFSETEEILPKLPTTFKNKDIEVLYGIKNFKRMFYENNFDGITRFRKRRRSKKEQRNNHKKTENESGHTSDSGDSISSNLSARNIQSKKRKLAARSTFGDDDSVFAGDSGSSIADSEQTLDRLSQTNLQLGKRVKIKFDSRAQKIMEELKEKLSKVKKKYDGNIPSNVRVWFLNRLYSSRNVRTRNSLPLSMNTMMLILHTSLLLMEDDIQLADLMRWITEGRLSFFQPRKLIPLKNIDLKYTDGYLCSRSNHLGDMSYFTRTLTVSDVPTPDLLKLVKRYCYELNLPNYVQRIMSFFPPQMDYALYNYRIFPDYECRAMGFILFTFKLLFSLDDATEFQQAKFADLVNERSKTVGTIDVPELFSWLSWMKYVECRKTVLAKYNVFINSCTSKDYDMNHDIVMEHWKKVQPDVSHAPEEKRINSVLKSQIENTIHQLRQKCGITEKETLKLCFPSSLTPCRTYTDYLLSKHPGLIHERSRQILTTNFEVHSINYLVDPNCAIDIGKKVEIEVQPIYNIANDEIEQYEEPETKSTMPVMSNGKAVPAYVPIAVDIFSEEIPDKVDFEEEMCESKIDRIGNETNGGRMPHVLQLHYPNSNYWFFHPSYMKFNPENFSELVEENFPHSFVWILKECASIIRTDYRDLFKELMVVEVALSSLFADDSYLISAPIHLLATEW